MPKQKFIEIRMGSLAFLDSKGILTVYNQQTQRFNKRLTHVSPMDRIVMGLVTCAGVFIRNLEPNADIPFAFAHAASLEIARRMMGWSHDQLREFIRSPEASSMLESILNDLAATMQRAVDETYASFFSPILGSDVLANHVTQIMGAQLEVHVFGGESHEGEETPYIVADIAHEFTERGITAIVEPSLTNMKHEHVILAPYESNAEAMKSIPDVKLEHLFETHQCIVVRLKREK